MKKSGPLKWLRLFSMFSISLTAVAGMNNALASADVVAVDVSGSSGSYDFAVTLKSPDAGCSQYANWWEVLSEDGKLIYRRILWHSHVDEQPFTRSGGPVHIGPDTVVYVRAHMKVGGYGGMLMKGTVHKGFQKIEPKPSFAADAERLAPQTNECWF